MDQFYAYFDKQNPVKVFYYIRDLIKFWDKKVTVFVDDKVLKELSSYNKKVNSINDDMLKMTFKFSENEYVDIIMRKSDNSIVELAIGPLSKRRKTCILKNNQQRKIYLKSNQDRAAE